MVNMRAGLPRLGTVCDEYRLGVDMGAFGPSVHTLPVTVGHSRLGRGGNGLAGRG